MPKAILKKPKKTGHHPEAKGLLFIGVSFFLLLCLISFVDGHHEENWLGFVGHVIAYLLHYVWGMGSYLIIAFLMWMGWRLLKARGYEGVGIKLLYFNLLLLSVCILLNLIAETKWIDLSFLADKVYSESAIIYAPHPIRHVRINLGGVPYYYLYRDLPHFNLQHLFGDFGAFLSATILGIVSFILLTDLSFFRGVKTAFLVFPLSYDYAVKGLLVLLKVVQRVLPKKTLKPSLVEAQPIYRSKYSPHYKPPEKEANFSAKRKMATPISDDIEESTLEEVAPPPKKIAQIPLKTAPKEPKKEEEETSDVEINSYLDKKGPEKKYKVTLPKHNNYSVPPLSLLSDAKMVDQTGLKKELKKRSDILEETLLSFGIEAKVGHIYAGPTVTLFELLPAIGVKVQKIKALENDIALNLQAKSIRIIAPIPGKAAVGVEIPSLFPQEVGFKEMLSTYHQMNHGYHIPMLLGKTVSGEEVICDLTKMPHCIIAGATGSGKSVCINTIIMSILMNLSPDDVRLILIDPKKVELTPFSNLPHLVAPVITEPSGAYAALQWLVKEMQGRYEILKRLGVRNITAFNKRTIDKPLEEALGLDIPEKMHFIVCIIDEFADLMMTSSADLETPIARIAQMARAVGIHLILATQRPSREVITGLIKANFPTRIAFKVSSRINSQIILDENGAEALLGNGDMLFLPPGSSQLIRCQGVYIRDEDISKVVEHIVRRVPTHYLLKSFDNLAPEMFDEEGEESSSDPLYEKALEIVQSYRTASTTFLQRKLKIGYARAAALIDQLEQNGVIGPQEGSKPRKILKDFLSD